MEKMLAIQYTIVILVGLLMGNFATTLLYRLPRGVALSGFNTDSAWAPFCSVCKHKLKFYEHLPVLGWIITLGRCSYCKAKINKHYLALELLAAILAVANYILYGVSDTCVIMFVFGLLCITSAIIYLEQCIVMPVMTVSITILGCIYRTFIDHSIFAWLFSLGIAGLFCLFLLRQSPKVSWLKGDCVHSLVPASVWCVSEAMGLYIGTLLASYLFLRELKLYPYTIIALYLVSIVSR